MPTKILNRGRISEFRGDQPQVLQLPAKIELRVVSIRFCSENWLQSLALTTPMNLEEVFRRMNVSDYIVVSVTNC
jgi:hypothetical protein